MPALSTAGKIVRASNWWAKIPPLLTVAYAEFLLHGTTARAAAEYLVGIMAAVFSVAAYGHVVNDVFDIESDARAGKPNAMAGRRPAARIAYSTLFVVTGALAAWWVDCGPTAALLLAANYLLPTIYSAPPVRLKEWPLAGALADASGAHVVPTLFVATAISHGGGAKHEQEVALAVAAALWAFSAGIRGILMHQLYDRAGDLASGVRTLATEVSPERVRGFLREVAYPAEVLTLALFVWVLDALTPWVPLVFAGFAVIEMLRVALQWRFEFQPDQAEDQAYQPLANNVFYELWLPLTLAVALAQRGGWLVVVPALQLAMFYRTAAAELSDLARLIRQLIGRAVDRWRRIWIRPSLRRWHPRLWNGAFGRLACSRSGGLLRIALDRMSLPHGRVRVSRQVSEVASGNVYRLTFRARATDDVALEFGIASARPPWRGLGLSRRVTLTGPWREYFADFVASAADAAPHAFFLCSGAPATVEIEGVALCEMVSETPWLFEESGGAGGELLWPEGLHERLRVEVRAVGETAEALQLSRAGIALRAGGIYRLAFRARGERERGLRLGISENRSPWADRGLHAKIRLEARWQRFESDFVALADDGNARLHFDLGEAEGTVELRDISVVAIGREDALLLEVPSGSAAHVLRSGPNDEQRLITVSHLSDPAEPVSVDRIGVTCRQGQAYRVSLTARGTGELVVGLIEPRPPWNVLGLWQRVRMIGERRSYVAVFRATGDAEEARLRVTLAPGTTQVELFDIRVESIDETGSWFVEADPRVWSQPLLAPGEARLEILEAGEDADQLRMVRDFAPVSKGQLYRLALSAQSSVERPVRVAVRGKHDPDENIGLWREVFLRPAMPELWFDFVAVRDEAEPQLMLGVGQATGLIDVEHSQLTALDGDVDWRLMIQGECRAARLGAPNSQTVQLEVFHAGATRETLDLYRDRVTVEAGRSYRLLLRLQATPGQWVLVVLRTAGGEWKSLGLWQEIELRAGLQEYWLEFTAAASDSNGRLSLLLGDHAGPITLRGCQLIELVDPERWQFRACGATWAQRLASGNPDDLRLQFRGSVTRELTAVRRLGRIESGRVYRIRFRVHSEQPCTLFATIQQEREPWNNLGFGRRLQCDQEDREFLLDFVGASDEEQAQLCLQIEAPQGEIVLANGELQSLAETQWLFESSGSEQAQVVAAAVDDAVCLEILSTGQDAQSMVAAHAVSGVEAGSWYRLRVCVAADPPREVRLGFTEATSPWTGLGLWESVLLLSDPRELIFDVQAAASAERTRLQLMLGDGPGRLTLGSVSCEPLALLDTRQVALGGDSRVTRYALDRAGAERWEFAGNGKEFRAEVRLPQPPLLAQRPHRIEVDLRADALRSLVVCVQQAREPWDLLFKQQVSIGAEWRRVMADFWAGADEPSPRLLLRFAEDATPVEVGEAVCRPIDAHETWQVKGERTRTQLELVPGVAQSVRVPVSEEASHLRDGKPFDLTLFTPRGQIVQGAFYQLQFRCRADRPRTFFAAVRQARAPWESVGLWQRCEAVRGWRTYSFDFRASGDTPNSHVLFALGEDTSAIEFADVRMGAIADRTARVLQFDADARARFVALPDRSKVRLLIEAGGKGFTSVRLSTFFGSVRRGERYRLEFRARASRSRTVACVFCENHAPWAKLAEYRKFRLGSRWQRIRLDFECRQDDEDAWCYFGLGGSAGMVEIGNGVWSVLPERAEVLPEPAAD